MVKTELAKTESYEDRDSVTGHGGFRFGIPTHGSRGSVPYTSTNYQKSGHYTRSLFFKTVQSPEAP